jgi:hypothetical protein
MAGLKKTGPAQKAKKRRATAPWTPSYPFETSDRASRFHPHRWDNDNHRYDGDYEER